MKLRGDRCQCKACGEYFNSTHAFDKHRVGKYSDRRCLTAEEMTEKLAKNMAGFWIGGKRPDSSMQSFYKRLPTVSDGV